LLRNGEWYGATAGLVVEGTTLSDLLEALAIKFQFKDEVAKQLIFKGYHNHNAPLKKRKVKYINNPSAKIPMQNVLLQKEHILAVHTEKGDKREVMPLVTRPS